MRRNFFDSQMPRVRLPVQEILVEHLQMDPASKQRRRQYTENSEYQRYPTNETAFRFLFGFCAARHRLSIT